MGMGIHKNRYAYMRIAQTYTKKPLHICINIHCEVCYLREAWRSVVEWVVLWHDGIVENGGRDREGFAHEVFPNNDNGDSGRTNILLSPTVNNTELEAEQKWAGLVNIPWVHSNFYSSTISVLFLYAMPTLETSTGLEKIFEDMSATSGTPFVSGINWNSTPSTVSLAQ